MCHRRVWELSKECNFARGMLRERLATRRWREKSLAARLSLILRKDLGSRAGFEAMQHEVKAVDRMGYLAHATSRSETRSNQQRSTLQGPFSSASLANMISEVIAVMAGEKASDATESRVW
jgi:hypothetical protein